MPPILPGPARTAATQILGALQADSTARLRSPLSGADDAEKTQRLTVTTTWSTRSSHVRAS
jgi:hypothetical protein